ncbi:MAG: hypothetical protein IPJ79_00670 [Bacteroidetes bacterium]|nr:hypothetical protein [Bacteroidota bacterium]
MGGFSDSNISGDKTENSNGVEDYWIIKTDAAGNIQWQNTIEGIMLIGYTPFNKLQTGDIFWWIFIIKYFR